MSLTKDRKSGAAVAVVEAKLPKVAILPAPTQAYVQVQPETQKVEAAIKSLCLMLGGSPTLPPYLGFVEDDDIQYSIYYENDPPFSSPLAPSPVSLSTILAGDVKPPLSRRQRYRLSLTLASSFVQLKDSPWLQASWGKDGVHFAPGTQAGQEKTLRLDAPFVVRSFSAPTPDRPAAAGHDVAGIASLGIVLLELCFGRPVESHPSRIRFPSAVDAHTKAAFDLIAALEWLKEVNDEAGADYADAVEWCLAGCRALPSDGSWRVLMMERVVVPLEKCFSYLG